MCKVIYTRVSLETAHRNFPLINKVLVISDFYDLLLNLFSMMGQQSPWAITNLEELLYYCCPECDLRDQSEEQFIQHAFEKHPEAKNYLLPFKVKLESGDPYYNDNDYDYEDSNNVKCEMKYESDEAEPEAAPEAEPEPDETYDSGEEESKSDVKLEPPDLSSNSQFDDTHIIDKDKSTGDVQDDGIYECFELECPFTSKSRSQFLLHWEEIHKIERGNGNCSKCHKRLPVKGSLRYRHIKEHYNPNPKPLKIKRIYNCFEPECSFETNMKTKILRHLEKIHKLIKNGFCMKCNKPFAGNLYKKFKHMEDHATGAELKHKCFVTDCSFSANFKREVIEHLEQDHELIKDNKCQKCNVDLRSKIEYKYSHFEVHYKGGYKCDICGKEFLLKGNLAMHKRYTHSDEVHGCEHCGKTFKNLKTLDSHLKSHDENKQRYQCHLCINSYSTKQGLEYHISRVHEGVDTIIHQCHECGKKFQNKNYLNYHVEKVHKNTIPNVKCEQCGLSYTNKTSLKIHIKSVHKKERNYVCDVCAKAFQNPQVLKNHKAAVHDGIRKLKCELCEKSFAWREGLRRHMSSFHQGIRFECSFCTKSFTQENHLKSHVQSAHGQKYIYAKDLQNQQPKE